LATPAWTISTPTQIATSVVSISLSS
jgi:hypothetical protein